MTKLFMYDAAYAPGFDAVKRNGGVAVNCYLTGMYQDSTADPAAARRAGLGVVMTYEEGRSELVRAGRGEGQDAGRRILAALEREHVPLDGSVAVYPSVDVSLAQADACDAAWRGLRDVLHGKASVRYYGEGRVGDHLFDAGLLDGKYWLAAPSSWPGFDGTADTKRVCVVQLVGSPVRSTDQNVITDPHALGAWWPEGSPYARGDQVSVSDVITALKSAEGQELLQEAMLSAKVDLADPAKDATFGQVIRAWHSWLTRDQALLAVAADRNAFVRAIVAALPTGAGGLTADELEAAVDAGVRAVFADAGTK